MNPVANLALNLPTPISFKNALDIRTYIVDGFVKVCNVYLDTDGDKWFYKEINEPVMFSSHCSWVYFILVDKEIVKVGETGNPLGIRMALSGQPKTGSQGRFGRYRAGNSTDKFVRDSLRQEVKDNRVSLWARQCEIIKVPITVAMNPDTAITTFHKDLETKYLDHIMWHTGKYPRLNKSRK